MRQLILLVFTVALLLVGCSGPARPAADSDSPKQTAGDLQPAAAVEKAEPLEEERDVFVMQASYYRTKGPCIRMGDTLAMPVIDGFKVVEADKAHLKGTHIHVRALTEDGRNYPKQLVEGKVYALRFTPSAGTTRQLRENQIEGYSFVWIDGNELEQLADKGGDGTRKQKP